MSKKLQLPTNGKSPPPASANDSTMDIDAMINAEYNTGPAYITKPKDFTVSFVLKSNLNEDIELERVLDDWAETRSRTRNIKKAIGMFHAAKRRDISWFEDNCDWLIADIQLAGRIDMQEQIDEQKQEIDDMQRKLNEQDLLIKQIAQGLRYCHQQITKDNVVVSDPVIEQPKVKELNNGS